MEVSQSINSEEPTSWKRHKRQINIFDTSSWNSDDVKLFRDCIENTTEAKTLHWNEKINFSCAALEPIIWDSDEVKLFRDCTERTTEAKTLLWSEKINFSCAALETTNCVENFERYRLLADPISVYNRSMVCDIEMPRFSSVNQQELDFPLAYVITAFTDPRNVELSLATIFRPHNSYCIHIDQKSDKIFRETLENIMTCYRNKFSDSWIFSSNVSESVVWGHYSIVQAELNCLNDLMESNRNWLYALDMAGSEVMTYTNKELVANLSANLGEIYTESFPMSAFNLNRLKWKTVLTSKNQLQITDIPLGPIPFNLTIYKGAKAWKLPREFVQFLLTHPVANEFLEFCKYTYIPDETVIATLSRISDMIPNQNSSGFNSSTDWLVKQNYEPLGRYHFQLWSSIECRGTIRNSVCVFSLADLSTILKAQSIVINKVMTVHDPTIGECLRDTVRRREINE